LAQPILLVATALAETNGTGSMGTRSGAERYVANAKQGHHARRIAVATETKQKETKREMPGSHQRRETHDLIGSDKVEGTNVYRSNGEKIGQIERIMLEKMSGKVAYAVMSFGGFLGLGHDHYPVPWPRLTYNERLGGYEVDISDQELKSAPKYDPAKEGDWNEDQGRKVYLYYQITPYW
jgi:hypothetical protein